MSLRDFWMSLRDFACPRPRFQAMSPRDFSIPMLGFGSATYQGDTARII